METKDTFVVQGIHDFQSDPVHVLLVDDNPDDRKWIQRIFEKPSLHGSVIHEASCAKEAVKSFHERRPDCLLVDFHLPGSNGLELLASLPPDLDGSLPETILMTNDEDPQIVISAMRLGVRDFLRKSHLSEATLCHSLQRAIERRQLRRKLVKQREKLEEQNKQLRSNQRALLNITEDLEREINSHCDRNVTAEADSP